MTETTSMPDGGGSAPMTQREAALAAQVAQLTRDLEDGFMAGAYGRLKELQWKEEKLRDLEALRANRMTTICRKCGDKADVTIEYGWLPSPQEQEVAQLRARVSDLEQNARDHAPHGTAPTMMLDYVLHPERPSRVTPPAAALVPPGEAPQPALALTQELEHVRVALDLQADELARRHREIQVLRQHNQNLVEEHTVLKSNILIKIGAVDQWANVFEQSEARAKAMEGELTALRTELAMIDQTIGNRSTFDECKTRWDKITKAIWYAGKVDPLEAEVARLKSTRSDMVKALADRHDEIEALRARTRGLEQELLNRAAQGLPLVTSVRTMARQDALAGRNVTDECEIVWCVRGAGTDQCRKEFRIVHRGQETIGRAAQRYAFRRRTFMDLSIPHRGEVAIPREVFVIDLMPEPPAGA